MATSVKPILCLTNDSVMPNLFIRSKFEVLASGKYVPIALMPIIRFYFSLENG